MVDLGKQNLLPYKPGFPRWCHKCRNLYSYCIKRVDLCIYYL